MERIAYIYNNFFNYKLRKKKKKKKIKKTKIKFILNIFLKNSGDK